VGDGAPLRATRSLRLLLELSSSWQLEPDPARRSEVEVSFTAEGPDRTRVAMEHRHLDRHEGDWQGMRDGVSGENGWPLYLDRFAALI